MVSRLPLMRHYLGSNATRKMLHLSEPLLLKTLSRDSISFSSLSLIISLSFAHTHIHTHTNIPLPPVIAATVSSLRYCLIVWTGDMGEDWNKGMMLFNV